MNQISGTKSEFRHSFIMNQITGIKLHFFF